MEKENEKNAQTSSEHEQQAPSTTQNTPKESPLHKWLREHGSKEVPLKPGEVRAYMGLVPKVRVPIQPQKALARQPQSEDPPKGEAK
jgi:hypothetical protein